jgi:hypothetical protein
MPRLRYVQINGQRLLWKDVVAAYREQARAVAKPEQPMLFENLHVDYKPLGERTASERFEQPNLFDSLKL